MKIRWLALLSLGLYLLGPLRPLAGWAAVDWPVLGFTQVVSNSFSRPTCLANASDGSQRLFVVQQPGTISIIQAGTTLTEPFLNITDRVSTAGQEQGLLGLAFPQEFPFTGEFYVDYTSASNNTVVVSRFLVSQTNANVADPASEQVILTIPKPYSNHNGGQLAFGPGGYLYIGVGDGGSEGDPLNFGQNTNALLGKILRIDVHSRTSPYGIPPDNPFVNTPGYAPEIWAYGLRNPWRFSFDSATYDLYIADVGQDAYEEIDFQPVNSAGGQNYGWRMMEGPTNYAVPTGFSNFGAFTPPVACYSHASIAPVSGGGAAVVGGYVYHGPSQQRMEGMYFYGDFLAGWIWGLTREGTNWQSVPLYSPSTPSYLISSFGQDEAGELYFADYARGRIYQVYDTQQVWPPVFSPVGGVINSNGVILACVSPNAEIHITTNGVDPTLSDPIVASGTTLQVVSGVTYKARAFRSDLIASAVTSASFTLKVGTPTFSPPGGVIANNTPVTISTVTPNATLYYTTDGTTPTTSSSPYTGPVLVSGGTTLQALGVAPGYADSDVASASYFGGTVATPTFTPAGGVFTHATAVTVACATSGATIRYTLDGSIPTTNSPVYSGPILISQPTTVTAVAFRSDLGQSVTRSAFYAFALNDSTVVTTYAGATAAGFSNAVGALAQFNSPQGLCWHPDGRLLVADQGNNVVRQILPGGTVLTFAGSGVAGSGNGAATNAQFIGLTGVCADETGDVFVSGGTCGGWEIRQIDTNGQVSTVLSMPSVCANIGQMETDAGGVLYAGYGPDLRRILLNGQVDVALSFGPFSPGPVGVGVDTRTNVYAVSSGQVWHLAPDGNQTLLAGSSTNTGFSDGPALRALFQGLSDAAVDVSGNIYLSDGTRVRRVSPSGTVTTVAGMGVAGYANGRGSVAQFNGLVGICVDTNGNVYVCDRRNNCIRKIAPDTAGIGIPDDWQLAHFGYIGIDPQADPDHDGMSNYAEFWAGNDPLDARSVLRLDSSSGPVSGHMQLRWQSVAGKSYTVQFSSDLVSWSDLGSSVGGDGSLLSVIDPTAMPPNGQRFYRIALTGF